MTRRSAPLVAALAVLALFVASCGDSDSEGASDSTTKTTADAGGSGDATVTCDESAFKEAGKLTVATGEPAFPPWVEDDKPEDGKGFEAALTYDIAEQLGIPADAVTWTRTGFDEAVAPGEKDYDFNIQQYSINPERAKVVALSDPYYDVQQAIIGRPDGPLADATSLDDLKGAKLGAAVGTTSLDYIDDYIQPDTKALVFDDNAAAKAAFDANQVDGIVFDLPTAYYITSAEITDSSIIGILPTQGETEQLGILLEKDSDLVSCVNEAIANLTSDGTLEALQQEWLAQGGDIPTLEK